MVTYSSKDACRVTTPLFLITNLILERHWSSCKVDHVNFGNDCRYCTEQIHGKIEMTHVVTSSFLHDFVYVQGPITVKLQSLILLLIT